MLKLLLLPPLALALAACGARRALPDPPAAAEAVLEAELVVYGDTSAAIACGVRAARLGRSVLVIAPDVHLGGLSSNGLGFTDSGEKTVIGGLAREFYHRVWQHYAADDAWVWQTRDAFGNRGQHGVASDPTTRTMWVFEPRVAEGIFEDLVAGSGLRVERGVRLDRTAPVEVERGAPGGPRIVSFRTQDGRTVRGDVFVDATYEGDLMAAAGVPYTVGRESNATFGETWNGVQPDARHHGHHFGTVAGPVDPYVVPGDPSSGLLPLVSSKDPIAQTGSGDARVQSYCFRLCMTDVPENRVPFEAPEHYDPAEYELVARVFEAGWRNDLPKFDAMPNGKTDTNNHGPVSFDFVGAADTYPEASDDERARIVQAHADYQRGLLYFLRTSPRVPEGVRAQMERFGLSRDEFADNGHWPYQVYVREARRMRGAFTMTEHEVLGRRPVPEPVGMGSYVMDSHNVQRYVTADGRVENEGDVGVRPPGPYGIAYGALVPRREDCANLLVPVCLSSSHIAFGSLRMEPVFMVLGDSAAVAADLALERGAAVQDVPYGELRSALESHGQVLRVPPELAARLSAASARRAGRHVDPASLEGVVLDAPTLRGPWTRSTSSARFVGADYHHDGDARNGGASAVFETVLDAGGAFEVRLLFPHASNRATCAPVRVECGNAAPVERAVDQRARPPIDGLAVSLGTFRGRAGETVRVTVSNAGADGYVVADAVQLVPTGD